ncbi:hypothetical protein BC940DRAFT_326618 [Gongronella butleri]|nr:hypothetical protein BC940DRAFT_326618 [Gongronella butleri]
MAMPQDTPLLSPCIDIQAQRIPDTMLVALLNRPDEMQELVKRNQPFFGTLRGHLDTRWSSFSKTLLCSRDQMPDRAWMASIERAIHHVPGAVITFKELVGYMDDEPSDHASDDAPECEFLHVDLCQLRRNPSSMHRLPTSYPQFMINCQQALTDDAVAKFDALLSPESAKLSDDEWKHEINLCLGPHANLLDQFKEIVAYEIEEADN